MNNLTTITSLDDPLYFTYNNIDLFAESLHFALGFVGSMLITVILIAIMAKKCTPPTLLFIALLWGDLIFCLTIAITGFGNLTKHSLAIVGSIGCDLQGGVILFTCCQSIMSLTCIALERYIAVVWNKRLSMAKAYIASAFIWIFSIFIGFLPSYVPQLGSVVGQPGKLICMVKWWSTDTLPLIVSGLVVSMVLMGSCGLTFFYYRIVSTFLAASASSKNASLGDVNLSVDTEVGQVIPSGIFAASMGKVTNGIFIATGLGRRESDVRSPTSVANAKANALERRLIINALSITGCFIVLWAPYLCLIFISLATKQPVSAGFDQFCTICAVANSAFNPILLYRFDGRIRNNVNELLRLTM